MTKKEKAEKERLAEVLRRLEETYYGAKPGLHFQTPFELLIATVLSAQCTDVQVNKVTEKMYQRYNTPEDFAALTVEELEPMIKSCGYYKAKPPISLRLPECLLRNSVRRSLKRWKN